jgi:hypothetical protein
MEDERNDDDLFRPPNREWLLHTRRFATADAPTLTAISEKK